MKLKLQIPSKTLVDCDARKITAEAVDGSFCLLPAHVDFVAPLTPGLFAYETETDKEILALDSGVLVKCGEEVLVSARGGVRGRNVSELQETIRQSFEQLDEHEKKSRSALARMEAAFVTRFVEMQEEQ